GLEAARERAELSFREVALLAEALHSGDEAAIERLGGLRPDPRKLALVDQALGQLDAGFRDRLVIRVGENATKRPGGLLAALLHRLLERVGARLPGRIERILDVGLDLLGRFTVEPEDDLSEESTSRHVSIPPGFVASLATHRRASNTVVPQRPRS